MTYHCECMGYAHLVNICGLSVATGHERICCLLNYRIVATYIFPACNLVHLNGSLWLIISFSVSQMHVIERHMHMTSANIATACNLSNHIAKSIK